MPITSTDTALAIAVRATTLPAFDSFMSSPENTIQREAASFRIRRTLQRLSSSYGAHCVVDFLAMFVKSCYREHTRHIFDTRAC
jgi:hypothetical protein